MKKSELRQIIKEELNKVLEDEDTFNEGQYKVDGHVYNLVPAGDGKAYIGFDGILGNKDKLIPWEDVIKYSKKFMKETNMWSGDSVNYKINEADVIEKGIKRIFQKLRDKKNKRQIDQMLADDPELAKALDKVAQHGDKLADLISSF